MNAPSLRHLLPRLTPLLLAAGIGLEASAGSADLEGALGYRIDGDSISIVIERIANNSDTATGSLYVTVFMTRGSSLYDSGYEVARARIGGATDGRLNPGQYFGDIRWTLVYHAPPPGTYYVHFFTSQHPEPDRVLDSFTFTDREVVSGDQSDDHGDTRAEATGVAPNSTTAGSLEQGGDDDYFRFEVPARGAVVVETTGSTDTYGTLENSAGEAIETNDDGGTDYNFKIERTLNRGTYYVRVQGYSDTETGDYTLRVSHTPEGGNPDLVIQDISASASTLSPGDSFTLSATVLNQATDGRQGGDSAATTLRWLRSSDGTIESGDLEVGTDPVVALSENRTSEESIDLTAPASAGTYHYGACVDTVDGEHDVTNNCSGGVRVAVVDERDAAGAAHMRHLGDFNGDGKADVLLRHAGTGRWHYYPMDGRTVLSGAGAANLTHNLTVSVAGIGDLNGDGKDDVLMRRANGTWYYYPMDGRSSLAGRGEVALPSDLAWAVAGIGDFNGDGNDDVLLRHSGTGRWYYYPMDGRTVLPGTRTAGLTHNLTVSVAGIGDLNGDGRDDVLMRRANGTWYYYPMDGRLSLAGRGGVALPRDLAWAVAGIGDFNGDGNDDVLLRHTPTGQWHYYPMDGRTVLPGPRAAGLTHNVTVAVAGIGDLNGDGKDDVLMRRANGTWYYYPMDGRRSLAGRGEVALSSDLAWSVAGSGAATDDRLRVSTAAGATVRPFQTIPLAVSGGTADAEYDVLVDLSGSANFADEDTIEIAPVKGSGNRLLVAAPLPETLAEGNTVRRFAVRLRERDGEEQSEPITLTLDPVAVPTALAGHPTVILDVVLKGVYEGLDDPLLTVEAGAIEPGRSVRTARTLGLSTAYSDAQAEALLRSLFGTSLVAPPPTSAESAPPAWGTASTAPAVRCEILAPDALCDAYRRLADCVGDALDDFASGRPGSHFDHCANVVREDIVETFLDYAEKIHSVGNFFRNAAPRLAGALGLGGAPSQQLLDRNAAMRQVIGLLKTLRAASERGEETADQAREAWEAIRDGAQVLTEGNAELIDEAGQAAAEDGLEDDERDAHWALVEEADHHEQDAAAIEDLEDVYTGEADVVETLGTVAEGDGGAGGGATCGGNYEEFPVDDKTSTCVWHSLVEPSCYAGSRQVSHPNLGGANVCLYYSLDFFQADGGCRENYAKVTFQGRETCRWAELGTDWAAWYTLEKAHGVASPQTPVESATEAVGDGFRDCAGCPTMVRVPAGTFTMGAPESEPGSNSDERPQRAVSIPAFAAGAHEVTFAEWDACVAAGGCDGYRPDDEGWGRGDRPVINVSWHDAQLYVEWLSRSSGRAYRLLTESEWEYAARAGTATPFHTGGTITPQQANFNGRYDYPDGNYIEGGLYREQTVSVGSFAPNGFGLHDMHGNVWEWVQDCGGSYEAAPSDGSAVEGTDCVRVLRGGSWGNGPWDLRSALRDRGNSGVRYFGHGFRVARTLTP